MSYIETIRQWKALPPEHDAPSPLSAIVSRQTDTRSTGFTPLL
jgi:hypothetical protein